MGLSPINIPRKDHLQIRVYGTLAQLSLEPMLVRSNRLCLMCVFSFETLSSYVSPLPGPNPNTHPLLYRAPRWGAQRD